MKSEKETIYDYAAELKLLAVKEELECTNVYKRQAVMHFFS